MVSNTKSKYHVNKYSNIESTVQNTVIIQPIFDKLRLDRKYFFDTINHQRRFFVAYLKNVGITSFRCSYLECMKGDLCMPKNWVISVKSLDEITYHKLPLPSEIIDYISTF